MHILVAIVAIAGFIAYVFGETTARAFVGAMLGLGAAAVLMTLALVILDGNRHPEQPRIMRAVYGSRI